MRFNFVKLIVLLQVFSPGNIFLVSYYGNHYLSKLIVRYDVLPWWY